MKIIIIGAGFAGLAAANKFSSSNLGLEVMLIDRKTTSDFLPSLPDCIGRGIKPEHLIYSLDEFNKKINFFQADVTKVDFTRKIVAAGILSLNYDYLLIASGSETNFYGNENIRNSSFKLDDARDALKLSDALNKYARQNYIIAGGGYTGIEVATNLRLFLMKHQRQARIIIVERQESLLGPLPGWMKDYTLKNLKRLNIEVFTQSTVEKIEDAKVFVSSGRIFDNALVVWAAGVKTSSFIQDLKVEKNPQGRIKVDDYLRLKDTCFVAGDAAYVPYKDTYLRMAVQFSLAEGEVAAENIIRSIKNKPLKKYKPLDLGYIIPMANNRSCGNVFGVNLKGALPTLLHFMMCIYRLRPLRNKIGFLKHLIR